MDNVWLSWNFWLSFDCEKYPEPCYSEPNPLRIDRTLFTHKHWFHGLLSCSLIKQVNFLGILPWHLWCNAYLSSYSACFFFSFKIHQLMICDLQVINLMIIWINIMHIPLKKLIFSMFMLKNWPCMNIILLLHFIMVQG